LRPSANDCGAAERFADQEERLTKARSSALLGRLTPEEARKRIARVRALRCKREIGEKRFRLAGRQPHHLAMPEQLEAAQKAHPAISHWVTTFRVGGSRQCSLPKPC
jgi:hypothetical protein